MIQVMAYHLHDIKPLLEPMLAYHELNMYDEKYSTGLILGLRPANEIRRYFVTASLIGWTQTSVFNLGFWNCESQGHIDFVKSESLLNFWSL